MTCHAARRMTEWESRLRRTRTEVGRAIETENLELAGLPSDRAASALDAAARDLAAGVLARLEARDHEALAEIRAAEARLAAGTYGVCEACGNEVPAARLRALPATRYCVTCEAAVEAAVR
jgi:RNA polymerase-binding transcription factor DksA